MGITPDTIGSSLGSFFNGAVMDKLLLYAGYTVIIAIICVGMFILYMMMQYKYKVMYPILNFVDGDKQEAQVISVKFDRARDVKVKDVKLQKLLWKRTIIPKFQPGDVRPGNKVYLARLGDDGTYTLFPHLKFDKGITAFSLLNPEETQWAKLQLQQDAKKYESEDARKEALFITMGAIVLSLVLCGVTVWLCLKAPNKVIDKIDWLGSAIANTASSLGGTPPG